MGTNKRYADAIDRRASPPVATPVAAPSAVKHWQPPWPPVRIGVHEWIIMRDSRTEPAGVIRVVKLGPRSETFYRVVTWQPTSAGRALVGYFATIQEADRSILFERG